MQIKIRYFAWLRERRGVSEEWMTLETACTVAGLFQQIFEQEPTGIRFAINAEYVDGTAIIEVGDEVAFLPPMGGG